MQAYQVVEWGAPPEFVDVPKPTPGAGEILVRMKGAGLCRSDLDIMDSKRGQEPYASILPARFTLGHENAGIVEAIGGGVTGIAEGDGVVVHHMHSCGHCDFCHHGAEQSCRTFARGAVSLTRGVGIDGGLAPFLLVPRHELITLGALDPVQVAPLTDAGVTAYRAVKSVLDRLHPGTVAVVIGIGGLGAYAVQFLKLLTASRVIALDVTEQRLRLGTGYGADDVLLSDARSAEAIMDMTGGRGADAVIDLVGTDATLALAAAVSRAQGRIVLVGMEGGSLRFGWGSPATSCEVAISMGSTRADLREVCELAAAGKLIIDLERFAFDNVAAAYTKLRAGQMIGRAVITFD